MAPELCCAAAVAWPRRTASRTNFSKKAELLKELPVSPESEWIRIEGLETMAAWWEEAFSTLLSATRYLQCQPELWVATYEGILWPKLGSGAGAVTQSSVLGLWMCSCNFSAVAPTQESWAAPGLQGPSSFPFLDCVIFPPLQ